MKKSSSIITHIKNRSFCSKIKNIECFNKIKSLLPGRLSNAILFMYIKNKTLFIALNHPGLKMEFNYNVNLIKRLLKELKKIDLSCKSIEVDDIRTFTSNKLDEIQETSSAEIAYKERSKGEFLIHTDDKNLIKIFENIKKIINKIEDLE